MDSNGTDFTQPWEKSDVIFLVEDQKVHANKTLLSMWSPVMDAMFTGEFKVSGGIILSTRKWLRYHQIP